MLSTVVAPRPTAPLHGFPRWNASIATTVGVPGVPHKPSLRTDLGRVEVSYALNGIARHSYVLQADMASTQHLDGVTTRAAAIAAAQGLLAGQPSAGAFAVLQAAAGSWMVQRVVGDDAATEAFSRTVGTGGLAGIKVIAGTPALEAIVGAGGVYAPVAVQQR